MSDVFGEAEFDGTPVGVVYLFSLYVPETRDDEVVVLLSEGTVGISKRPHRQDEPKHYTFISWLQQYAVTDQLVAAVAIIQSS